MTEPAENGRVPGVARIVLEALPLAVVLLAGLYWLVSREAGPEPGKTPAPVAAAPELEPLAARSADDLIETFSAHGYGWPPAADIPRLAVASLPADLADQPPGQRKALFMQILLPLILAENNTIRREQKLLNRWDEAGTNRDAALEDAFHELRQRYRVDEALTNDEARAVLAARVDVVPPALALAQAAIETGWGTSRFARQGNNLFGQWTWEADQGLAPSRREAGARHYVRRFLSLRTSVRGYLHNLNTHPAYVPLRQRREAAREAGERPDGASLAGGLARYSERGSAYVADVRTIIRQNRLVEATGSVRLRSSER